ncbi:gliding motility-associated C-terminal domain-containing protein [Pontibacter diazotrophicus]|uniref:Gliding motility-associated C-terminal domain-containing protein n=1 Tax=Pontibacter diazotrophicus TaxID=1400979 RepID=A0A3D8LEQ9_9BACT|nr:gliding motility-associated C-terminal domain-containing protein [Pontibacter diazotrophicus]RDV15796.1 gliding motility-associated C-terminal domain-containing protein [Pontibacter diazotrophicus]
MPFFLDKKYLWQIGLLWLLVLLLGTFTEAQATHIRAGDITAKRDTTPNPNPRRFFFTMTIYRDTGSTERNLTVDIDTGEGMLEVDVASVTDIGNETEQWVYTWEHTYGSDGTFVISWNGINRNNFILNMAAPSQQHSFYIETVININALRGFNSTPALTVAPIDVALVGRRFVHNPGAYDADGDSLSFKLIVPRHRDVNGNISPVPAYSLPHLTFICETGDACDTGGGSGPATLSLDPLTGQMTWDAPCRQGEYNVAFVVEEWRISPNGGAVKLGEVVRDMQILVEEALNCPPVLEPKDTCIVAGTELRGVVVATDPDGDLINLTVAGSGIVPPATFEQTVRQPGEARGLLNWLTDCGDVRERPYQVVFRAEDVRPPGETRLADLQAWNIRVVGPAPENLAAQGGDRSVTLNWDPYACQNASAIRIYRREGPSGFVPDECETGVPASTGYVLVGEVEAGVATFFDDNGGEGLQAGVEYCYIIYAEFPAPARGESLASNEACVAINQDIPYLTNVTVDETDIEQGQVTVRWTQPEVSMLTPPLEYRLYRKEGMGAGEGFVEVFRSREMADTVFVDTGLNTQELAYRYRLEFYQSEAGGEPTELRESVEASSVRLEVAAAAGDEAALEVSWTYEVPWDNGAFLHRIYRQEGAELVLIDSVQATGSGGSYRDTGAFGGLGLERGRTYCYVVETAGGYGIAGLPEPLRNRSQEACALLERVVCAPELSVDQLDCEAFARNPQEPPYENVLTWVPQVTGDCTDQIAFYTVYFRPSLEVEYVALGTTEETTYTHGGLESFAGCYVVTATDTAGRESPLSNEVCKDNCISFLLPNIITPNGDGMNDVFRPDRRTAFIRSMHFRVFNRWGVQVYERRAQSGGDDLYINWAGVDNDGNRLTDGTYYYEAEVEFHTLDPSQARATYKGWVEIVR